ncbi:zinc finger BED domain-containing protein 4-like [Hippocampus comes]|uniref:zinc finger BED domain-containing protein 4-like n=1 Tax=Hippocampus comes TaxID=109280 RepID=UPI00094E7DD1|nr:PREDICTED: zinc finger BED domain-containing protein 4-like [Hippocampus comes]
MAIACYLRFCGFRAPVLVTPVRNSATVQSFFGPCPLLAMEPARKRRSSPAWEHFDLIASNKAKCLLCARELVYNNNTSSLLRHYRALHESEESHETGPSFESKDVDEALIKMVIEDCQPFTIVADEGFRKFFTALNPTYVLPTRKALKAMVDNRFKLAKEKAKEVVSKASAVSLKADMCPKKETV